MVSTRLFHRSTLRVLVVLVLFQVVIYLGYTTKTTIKSSMSSIDTLKQVGVSGSLQAIENKAHSSPKVVHRCKYSDYDVSRPPVVNVSEDPTAYFVTSGKHTCLMDGTLWIHRRSGCVCRDGYFGPWCSFPDALRPVRFDLNNIQPRLKPRRLVYATPFSVEFEMVEARMAEVNDIVDLFIVGESTYSGFGDEKPLRLLERLRGGYLCEYQHKLSYVHLGYFPPEAKADGWIADALNRDILGTQGLKYQVTGLKDDDLFVMTDTDELPTRQALLFFKAHDGFGEPFGFVLHRTVFGFFWRLDSDGLWKIFAGATMGMVRDVFAYKVSKLRAPNIHLPFLGPALDTYGRHKVQPWRLGEPGANFVGWHCTWCTDVERIHIKLASAINADFPRWGDYPEKRTNRYVKAMIKDGHWFDDKTYFTAVPKNFYSVAPPYLLRNKDNYKYLFENVYKTI